MADGIIPAVGNLVKRFRPTESSIREVTAAELLEQNRARAAAAGRPAPPATDADAASETKAEVKR